MGKVIKYGMAGLLMTTSLACSGERGAPSGKILIPVVSEQILDKPNAINGSEHIRGATKVGIAAVAKCYSESTTLAVDSIEISQGETEGYAFLEHQGADGQIIRPFDVSNKVLKQELPACK